MIILDKTTRERRWGSKDIAETPFFVDSRASRSADSPVRNALRSRVAPMLLTGLEGIPERLFHATCKLARQHHLKASESKGRQD
jgi:hypothetical protein